MMHRPAGQMPFLHPDENVFKAFCQDVLWRFSQFCSNDSSNKHLFKAFNRHREAKAVGFPIPARQ
jgi:hypothetical protein